MIPNTAKLAAGTGDPAHRAATPGGICAGIIKPSPEQHQPGTTPQTYSPKLDLASTAT